MVEKLRLKAVSHEEALDFARSAGGTGDHIHELQQKLDIHQKITASVEPLDGVKTGFNVMRVTLRDQSSQFLPPETRGANMKLTDKVIEVSPDR